MPDDNSDNQLPQNPSQDQSDPVFPYTSSSNPSQPATDPDPQTDSQTQTPVNDPSMSGTPQDTSSPATSTTTDNSGATDSSLDPAGSSVLSPPPSDPGSVVTSPQAPEKYGGKKVIATIFGVLLLVTAVGAGVYLVQQSVEYRQRAASGAACDQHPDCVLLDEPGNSGSYTAPRNISHIYITAREYHFFDPQNSDDGCYRVVINGQALEWQRYGSGSNCKDVSNVQVWLGEAPAPPPPSVSAQCSAVVAYDMSWNALSAAQLKTLKAGDTVRFAVTGTASSGFFDMAKFTINGQDLPETTNKRPGTEEFYLEYELPAGITNFNVNAQVHHSSLGWF